MIYIKFAVSLFILILSYCGNSPVVNNGTGTDIGEAKIFGSVQYADNRNADNVSVIVRKQDYVPYSVAPQNHNKTVSTNNGTFSLEHITPGYHLVELYTRDSLVAMKRVYISDKDTALNIGNCILDTMIPYTGKIYSDETPLTGGNLLVLGLDKKIKVNNDGFFTIRLPAGEQLFRIIPSNQTGSQDVFVDKKISGDTLRTYATTATMFDDFSTRDGFNCLSPLLGGGSWFAFVDQANRGNTQILPTEQPGLVAAMDTSSDSYDGSSLHCIFQIDSLSAAPYALIGCDISGSKDANTSKSWFDLSKMTAFSFMAKGSGTILVQFTCKPVGTLTVFTIYEIPVELSSQWKKYSITPSDIPAAITSTSELTVQWSDGNIAVSNINFLANRDTDLWLDNIMFEGMSTGDFLK
ncbi:MAG: hypothetical protein GX639_08115 [Fibrobacter sp.]|nr:hypothetical protein [Fibrobacter sp.]